MGSAPLALAKAQGKGGDPEAYFRIGMGGESMKSRRQLRIIKN